LTQRPITTKVDAKLPIDELDRFQPHRSSDAISYIRFEVVVGDGQVAKQVMPTENIYVRVDERPTPGGGVSDAKLETGAHRVVVGIIRDQFKGKWSMLIE